MKELRKEQVNKDPVSQFDLWFNEALTAKIHDPSVMNLATVAADGRPSSRIVLLKNNNRGGFTFFTNMKSRKGSELLENPYAVLTFYWPEVDRQIRIEGKVNKLPDSESDEYFSKRPRGSQISASISPQSNEIPDRQYLDDQFSEFEKKYENQNIQRPDFWGGFILKPDRFEFWQSRPDRLHDRILYILDNGKWIITRLGA